jgi:hypothetical protein
MLAAEEGVRMNEAIRGWRRGWIKLVEVGPAFSSLGCFLVFLTSRPTGWPVWLILVVGPLYC